MIWIYSLTSVIIVSLISLVGIITLFASGKKLCKMISLLVGLATGALFGGAFLHMIPEAYEQGSNTTTVSISILLGILFMLVLGYEANFLERISSKIHQNNSINSSRNQIQKSHVVIWILHKFF